MITDNFKVVTKMLLSARGGSSGTGRIPVKAYNGTVYYANGYFTGLFPASVYTSVTSSGSSGGILIGSGTTSPTPQDYKLEQQITSGFSSSVVMSTNVDESGNQYIEYLITINNTGSSDLVISEIGYQQAVYATTTQGGTNGNTRYCLFDRTVLTTPVTITAGNSGVIRYILKTVDAA